MTAVVWICGVLLSAGAVLSVYRIWAGPGMVDRAAALDLLTATLIAGIAVEAAVARRTDTIPIMLAVALLGFLGSITISRFAAREPESERRILTPAEARIADELRRAKAERDSEEGEE
jgi:multicomponent Na+:H+ antiporter subunit F